MLVNHAWQSTNVSYVQKLVYTQQDLKKNHAENFFFEVALWSVTCVHAKGQSPQPTALIHKPPNFASVEIGVDIVSVQWTQVVYIQTLAILIQKLFYLNLVLCNADRSPFQNHTLFEANLNQHFAQDHIIQFTTMHHIIHEKDELLQSEKTNDIKLQKNYSTLLLRAFIFGFFFGS